MRWFRIRKAEGIDPDFRATFERYGVGSMQAWLTTRPAIVTKGRQVMFSEIEGSLMPWLTEQYDRAERKETWSLTMEFAITIFVALEAVPIIRNLISKVAHWVGGP